MCIGWNKLKQDVPADDDWLSKDEADLREGHCALPIAGPTGDWDAGRQNMH